jgi:hypothetical protein
MDLTGLLQRLERLPHLGDPRAWHAEPITLGGVSRHTYRLQTPSADLFVKTTRDNESRRLRLLAYLDLAVCPRILYPELLDENLLVAQYVPDGPLREKRLEPGPVVNYCAMQNELNQRHLFESVEPFTRCEFHKDDAGGCYHSLIARELEEGYPKLIALRVYGLPIIEEYVEMAERVGEHSDRIAHAYATMPFAWLHHDFREDNIVGSPQKLSDWGSSYGHGPFAFDLAPFLILDPGALVTFMAHSDICRQAERSQILWWVFIGTCADFMGFLLWRVGYPDEPGGNWDTPEECRRFLEYEAPPFRAMLIHDVAPWRAQLGI